MADEATATQDSGSPQSRSGIPYATNREIEAYQARQRELEHRREALRTPMAESYAAHIKATYSTNVRHKQNSGVEETMLQSLRQRKGIYDPGVQAEITESGQSDAYLLLTAFKIRGAIAWIHDMYKADEDPTWDCAPTRKPDIPPEVQMGLAQQAMADIAALLQSPDVQSLSVSDIREYSASMRREMEEKIMDEARQRAKRMQDTIQDQQQEGGWHEAFSDFVDNLVTLKGGILKGPILRNRQTLRYGPREGGASQVFTDRDPKLTWSSVHPLDLYPAPGASDPNQGDMVEVIPLFPKALLEMKGIPDSRFNDAAIELVLNDYAENGFRLNRNIDSDRAILEDKGPELYNWGIIEAIEHWGDVSGRKLINQGIMRTPEGNTIDTAALYPVNGILVNNHLIYADFNADPLSRRPYFISGWFKESGSFWWKGVPELIRDIQRMCNGAIRGMANNMGLASGPGIVYNDINRVPPGQDITEMRPLQIYQFINPGVSNLKPVDTLSIESNAAELMEIIGRFSRMADDYSGIPAYEQGYDRVSGAGKTLGGLSILMSNAARGLRLALYWIGRYATIPAITRQVWWNMLYNPDPGIKGDIHVRARGVLAKLNREMLTGRRLEYLAATANPLDIRIMGIKRRAKIIDETGKTLELPDDEGRTLGEMDALEALVEESRTPEGVPNVRGGGRQTALPAAAAR